MTGSKPSVPPPEPGILNPGLAHEHFAYRRHDPDPEIAAWVDHFWTITWDLPDDEPYTAEVLPYPAVNVSVTNHAAEATGLVRSRYDRQLLGRGYVVGARFRPGCFRPWLAGPVSSLTDTHRPLAAVLGRDTAELERGVAAADDRAERVALLMAFLLADPPPPDPVAGQLADLVAEVAARPDLIRVAQLAELAGMSERRLQRLFVDYVGAGPKWVITRCRLQDAAARASGDPAPDWSSLAVELGFADQAHLTRAFSRTIGRPPAAYVAQLKSEV